MKNAPPTVPTVNPTKTTSIMFFLPINGVKSAVENMKTSIKMNSPNIRITVTRSMFYPLILILINYDNHVDKVIQKIELYI